MRRRLVPLLLVLATVIAATAGCIVVPVPVGRGYAPPPPVVYTPRPCGWVWFYGHWECR